MEGNESNHGPHHLNNSRNSDTDDTLLLQPFALSEPGSVNRDLNSDIDRLSSALYRLANRNVYLPYPRKPLNGPLEVIFNLTPKKVLLKVLESDSPTIQIAAGKLLEFSSILRRKSDFIGLIEAVVRLHPEWVCHGQYLGFAAHLGCVSSCGTLLRIDTYPNGNPFEEASYEENYIRAVFESVAGGHIECARLLVKNAIEVDATRLHRDTSLLTKVFNELLLEATQEGLTDLSEAGVSIDFMRAEKLRIMDWCIEAGVNVDAPLSSEMLTKVKGYAKYSPASWMPTALDYISLKNPDLYSHLVSHSVRFKTELTRPGLRSSANEGIESLHRYLCSRPSPVPKKRHTLLGIFLVEEFLRQGELGFNFKLIYTLLDYSFSLQEFHVDLSPSTMLFLIVRGAMRQGLHPAVHPILAILSRKGAEITADAMREAVEKEGINLLQLLSSFGADFRAQGASALCMAAKLNNYDAVDWLLHQGVDINAPLTVDGKERTVVGCSNLSSCIHRYFPGDYNERECGVASYEMIKYLVSRNAKLRADLHDTSPLKLLWEIIRYRNHCNDGTDRLRKVQYLLNAQLLAEVATKTEICLLEACLHGCTFPLNVKKLEEGLRLLEFLLECGISVTHSSVLSVLIRCNRPRNEIQRIIDSGADINAYSCSKCPEDDLCTQYTPIQAAARTGCLELVQFLIHRGADVNRQAKGSYGRTALQAACGYCLEEEVDHRNNIELVKYLINSGADVNAPAASDGGVTAFQAAAMEGHFEIALLLLDNGADINAPAAAVRGFCALDGTVVCRRLDMGQFLLNIGALSSERGESGYRGAIKFAEKNDRLVFADMIRQHAAKRGRSGEELVAHWSKWDHASSDCSGDSNEEDAIDYSKNPDDNKEISNETTRNFNYGEEWSTENLDSLWTDPDPVLDFDEEAINYNRNSDDDKEISSETTRNFNYRGEQSTDNLDSLWTELNPVLDFEQSFLWDF